MKKEPIRHHYIPQFILKNFRNENGKVRFFNKMNNTISDCDTSEVFMQPNLYRDNINYPEVPVQVENDFSKYEGESSKIVKKFLTQEEIELTIKEYDEIILFFALMSFRSYRAYKYFSNNKTDKSFYSYWQKDGNFEDFWKRNIGCLTNCRSLKEVLDNPNIDDPIKLFMKRDAFGLFGKYVVILERRGEEDFCISDAYPTLITGDIGRPYELPMYDFFPISPKRMLLLCSNGMKTVPDHLRIFKKSNLNKPKYDREKEVYRLHVTKVYEDVVKQINTEMYKNTQFGIVCENENCISSIAKLK